MIISFLKKESIGSFIIIFLFSITICFAQKKYNVDDSGLNGFYSGVVSNKSFRKPRMTHIYIYEYVKLGEDSKFFCQITQYQGKRASGQSKSTFYLAFANSSGTNSFNIGSIVNLDYRGNTHELKELKLLPNNQVQIVSYNKWNETNTITGDYKRKGVGVSGYDKFLETVYSKMFERTRRNKQAEDEIVWGLKISNTGKRYGSVKQSGIKLTSKVTDLSKLHNSEVIEMFYAYANETPKKSTVNNVGIWLSSILKHKYQAHMDPLIYHFPNLKEIIITNPKTGLATHNVKVKRGFYGFQFDARPTTDGLKEKKKEELQIARIAKEKIDREQAGIRQIQKAKEEKNIADALKGHNPSNEVLKLDIAAKGKRNSVNNLLFGKEFMDKFNQFSKSMTRELEDKETIKVIDAELYFKNIFYGNFDKLKPEIVSKNLFGSKNYFPEFYNAFLFYTNNRYGESYYPNMVSKRFDIITTETTTNYGQETSSSKTVTPYEIFLPKSFLSKFNEYLNKNQFSWTGEQFLLDFEYLILSFLDTYKSDSLPFMQMMQNMHRFSYGKSPVTKKEELFAF